MSSPPCLSKKSCFHLCCLYVKLGSSKYQIQSISRGHAHRDLLLQENKLSLTLGKNNYSQPGILQEFCKANVNKATKPQQLLSSSFPPPIPHPNPETSSFSSPLPSSSNLLLSWKQIQGSALKSFVFCPPTPAESFPRYLEISFMASPILILG